MTFGLKQGYLFKISDVIKSNKKIRRVLIFGSRAKGNYKEGSDIDICLEADDLSVSELNNIRFKLDELLLPYKIDIIDMNYITNDELKEHVLRVGREI